MCLAWFTRFYDDVGQCPVALSNQVVMDRTRCQ